MQTCIAYLLRLISDFCFHLQDLYINGEDPVFHEIESLEVILQKHDTCEKYVFTIFRCEIFLLVQVTVEVTLYTVCPF